MARKLNVPKPLRQNGEDLQAMNHRPPPSAATLYLMQLRAQLPKISPQPRRVRLDIDAETAPETPETVKIIKINSKD